MRKVERAGRFKRDSRRESKGRRRMPKFPPRRAEYLIYTVFRELPAENAAAALGGMQ